jgi:cell division protein FtsZ
VRGNFLGNCTKIYLNSKEHPLFDMNNAQSGTVIKVIGVGGAGGNAVNHMASSGVRGVEFICANTDAQALANTGGTEKIQLGESGLGAGSNPDVGRETAIRERTRIAEKLRGAHMVFVTAGMGGGTGTGAAPVVAEVAKELGILTVGVVSKPFEFEGPRRMRIAEEGIANLSKSVDSLIIVLNNRLEEVLGDDITQKQAFRAADDVLCNAVGGISEIINVSGMVNVDFQDVRTVMKEMGTAMMGTATCSGPDRAIRAAQEAIACPLLDGTNLYGARGLLVNIAASEETLKLKETKEVMNLIRAQTSENAIIKFGAVHDDSLGDEMRITVVATGLSLPGEEAPAQVKPQQFGSIQPTAPAAAAAPAAAQQHARSTPVPETSMFLRQRTSPAQAAPAAQQPAAARVEPTLRQPSVNNNSQDFGRTDVPPFMRHQQK